MTKNPINHIRTQLAVHLRRFTDIRYIFIIENILLLFFLGQEWLIARRLIDLSTEIGIIITHTD